MRFSLIIAALLVAPAVWSQESGPGAGATAAETLIASCIASIDGEVAGLPVLEDACPGLEHALVESGFAAFVSEAELQRLSRFSLVDLQHLADRYRSPPADAVSMSVDRLQPVLASLQEELRPDRPLTWFGRLKQWLRGIFDRQQEDTGSWWERWLRDVEVPQKVTQGILYGLVALIVLLAVAVVLNEVRVAGVLNRRVPRRGRSLGHDPASGLAPLTPADLDSVEPSERPAALLRMLVTTLVNSGRLRTEKSLTHRELGRRAMFDAAEQRECFERVASLGERLLYGAGGASGDEIDKVVTAGRALEHQLAAPRGAA